MPKAPLIPQMSPSGVPTAPASPTDFLMAAASMHKDGSLQQALQSPPSPRSNPLGTGKGARRTRLQVLK